MTAYGLLWWYHLLGFADLTGGLSMASPVLFVLLFVASFLKDIIFITVSIEPHSFRKTRYIYLCTGHSRDFRDFYIALGWGVPLFSNESYNLLRPITHNNSGAPLCAVTTSSEARLANWFFMSQRAAFWAFDWMKFPSSSWTNVSSIVRMSRCRIWWH